jgi:HupE / UreJ protein
MSEFFVYFQVGLHHILDINGYDHLLFLLVMAVPYAFKDWKRVLLLISLFTIGHTLSLLLSIFDIIVIKGKIIELLIPITILICALINFFKTGKTNKSESISIIGFITLFFGIIHGLGFSTYIKAILSGEPTDKLLPTLEFAIGIEAAQLLIALSVLLISFIAQSFFRFSRRDFILVTSSFVIGIVVPLVIKNPFFSNL